MSPRPRKWRNCRWGGPERVFKPHGVPAHELPSVQLTADELEALRLCDVEGLTQDEAGDQMGVSRGTIQRTIKTARRKVVGALLDGAMLALPGDPNIPAPPQDDVLADTPDPTAPTDPRGPGHGHGRGRCGGRGGGCGGR